MDLPKQLALYIPKDHVTVAKEQCLVFLPLFCDASVGVSTHKQMLPTTCAGAVVLVVCFFSEQASLPLMLFMLLWCLFLVGIFPLQYHKNSLMLLWCSNGRFLQIDSIFLLFFLEEAEPYK